MWQYNKLQMFRKFLLRVWEEQREQQIMALQNVLQHPFQENEEKTFNGVHKLKYLNVNLTSGSWKYSISPEL